MVLEIAMPPQSGFPICAVASIAPRPVLSQSITAWLPSMVRLYVVRDGPSTR